MTIRDLNKTRKIYRPFKREPKIDTSGNTTAGATTTTTNVTTFSGMRLFAFVVPFSEKDMPAFQSTTVIAL